MSRFLDAFRPDERVDSLAEIDLGELRVRGFDAIMLDLDNTLLPWKDSAVPEESRRWIESARAAGFRLCIVSNTHYPKRLERIAGDLSVPWVFGALKPRRHGFRKAAEIMGSSFETSVVVGDQLLTDVAGGNLAGMHTILVKPMHYREFIGTKLSRLIERVLFALFARYGKGDER